MRKLLNLFRSSESQGSGALSYFFERARGDTRGSQLADRWDDVEEVADLRAEDTVLDVGCAEGLVALAAARKVRHVHGLELLTHRVEAARKFAQQENIPNVTFEEASILDYEIAPLSYDVIFFLGVYAAPTPSGKIGPKELEKVLKGARRQAVIRVEAQVMPEAEGRLDEILTLMDQLGFDGLCFPKRYPQHGNIIIGNRRGSGVKVPGLPELVILPKRFATSHPIVRQYYQENGAG